MGEAARHLGMTNTTQTSVLITGANKGLGLEAARRLGERGWMIFLGSRTKPAAEQPPTRSSPTARTW